MYSNKKVPQIKGNIIDVCRRERGIGGWCLFTDETVEESLDEN